MIKIKPHKAKISGKLVKVMRKSWFRMNSEGLINIEEILFLMINKLTKKISPIL